MFRTIVTLFALLPLVLVAQTGSAADKGRLWRVESAQHQVSYLFGTMHSDDPRVTELPALVNAAFTGATSVTLEMELDEPSMQAMAGKMFLPESESLASILGDELYRQVVSALADYGMPAVLASRMKPWVVLMTLSVPPPKTGEFLDLLLYQRALQAGKTVHGLESAEEQIAVFEQMRGDDQLSMLRETLRLLPEYPALFERLIKTYLNGDLQGLMAMSEETYTQIPPEVNARVMQRLLVERNDRMVERMQPQLHEGGAFVAVGALHLPGDNGIIQQLRGLGYQVRAVY